MSSLAWLGLAWLGLACFESSSCNELENSKLDQPNPLAQEDTSNQADNLNQAATQMSECGLITRFFNFADYPLGHNHPCFARNCEDTCRFARFTCRFARFTCEPCLISDEKEPF